MRSDLLRALLAVIDPRDELLILHSSLAHLRPPGGRLSKWDALAALRGLGSPDRTLALPTFTFAFCRGSTFHLRRSPSETGRLGEWALDLEGFRRTPHPVYSFAVHGPFSGALERAQNSSTFGDDSIFARFEEFDGRVIMMGVDWEHCTQFHRYEEEASVPYRYFKTFEGPCDLGDGPRPAEVRMFVRDLPSQAVNDFSPIVRELDRAGAIRRTTVHGAAIASAPISAIAAAARALLRLDPYACVKDAATVAYRLERDRRAARSRPLRIALLGRANLETLRTDLLAECATWLPDRRVEVHTPPFGQLSQEILADDSALHRFDAEVTFFVDRLEDVLQRDSIDGPSAHEGVVAAVEEYLGLIERYAARHDGGLYVHDFCRIQPSLHGLASRTATDGSHALVAKANSVLERGLERFLDAHVFDLSGLATGFPGRAHDPRLWFLGRFPFSREFSIHIASRSCGAILASTGGTIRWIVVDLDDTLWGGVLGEEGLAGLRLGGDHPGNAYQAFQRSLDELRHRGIALAIASKNDEADAIDAIERLPGMVLRPGDFAARRIEWRPKTWTIPEMAEELGLGLEHALFIDDNPIERARMRLELPQVRVLELPEDPALFVAALAECPYLECVRRTTEDSERADRYRARAAAEVERRRHDRVEDFLASLDGCLRLQSLDARTLDRAEQLVQKTNQFNATTHRYTRSELVALAATGQEVVVLGYEDRFTRPENIGLMVVRWPQCEGEPAEIDTFLLSCRVLGRGIETAALAWIRGEAVSRGISVVRGRIVETERNAPVRRVYADHGFAAGPGPGDWVLRLRPESDQGAPPSSIRIMDERSVGEAPQARMIENE